MTEKVWASTFSHCKSETLLLLLISRKGFSKSIVKFYSHALRKNFVYVTVSLKKLLNATMMDKSQTGCPILYCKSTILRVGVWPIWVGPAHSPLGQLTLYTSSLTYSKMSCFQWVLLKIQQFEFLRGQFWFILVLSGKLEKCNWLPFQNYSSKIAHFWGC